MSDMPERIWIDKKHIPPSDDYAGTYYLFDDDEDYETIEYLHADHVNELVAAAYDATAIAILIEKDTTNG